MRYWADSFAINELMRILNNHKFKSSAGEMLNAANTDLTAAGVHLNQSILGEMKASQLIKHNKLSWKRTMEDFTKLILKHANTGANTGKKVRYTPLLVL